MFSQFVFLNFF